MNETDYRGSEQFIYSSLRDQILPVSGYNQAVLSRYLIRGDQVSFQFSINTQILFIIYCLVYTFSQVNIRRNHDNGGRERCILTAMLILVLTSRSLCVYPNPNTLCSMVLINEMSL